LGILKDEDPTSVNSVQQLTSVIRKALLAQGYSSVHILSCSDICPTASLETAYLTESGMDMLEKDPGAFFSAPFNAKTYTIPFVFLHGKSASGPEQLLKRYQQAEELFSRTFPENYRLLCRINVLEREQKKLRSQQAGMRTELENAESYRTILKTESNYIIDWYKKENAKITEWYNLQYECLPLWYKRFGHLLRMLLGRGPKKNKE
ncbi:MAG TPA: hypothetical protein VNZ86_04970, partial [Bacteroidia bacterium]|nr:hypothetical protein [Bacteroidia bacterium]